MVLVHGGTLEPIDAPRPPTPCVQSGCAALHTAAMNGHSEIVQYLLEAGANKEIAFTVRSTVKAATRFPHL